MASTAETHNCGIAARILVALIDVYRFLLSPWFGRQCRFDPSCSGYAREAIISFGALQGSYLALRRIVRCHPWAAGGTDPVPARFPRGCRHAHHPHG